MTLSVIHEVCEAETYILFRTSKFEILKHNYYSLSTSCVEEVCFICAFKMVLTHKCVNKTHIFS